jgi:deoxyribose-phosphate aldolase
MDRVGAVVAVAQEVPVKVILETGSLSEEGIVRACAIAWVGGAAYVKTSTGYGARGATPRDIEIMRTAVENRMRVKASGGIRTRTDAVALVAAGADVIGTSNGPACL